MLPVTANYKIFYSMYDKQSDGEIVPIDVLRFKSTNYEIWKGGFMIEKADMATSIEIISNSAAAITVDGIDVKIETDLSEDEIRHRMKFDVAVTSRDRFLLCIVPSDSNAVVISSFKRFLSLVPFRTREHKSFASNEPHACSIFFVNGNPEKITFTVTLSETLIEFYS